MLSSVVQQILIPTMLLALNATVRNPQCYPTTLIFIKDYLMVILLIQWIRQQSPWSVDGSNSISIFIQGTGEWGYLKSVWCVWCQGADSQRYKNINRRQLRITAYGLTTAQHTIIQPKAMSTSSSLPAPAALSDPPLHCVLLDPQNSLSLIPS